MFVYRFKDLKTRRNVMVLCYDSGNSSLKERRIDIMVIHYARDVRCGGLNLTELVQG